MPDYHFCLWVLAVHQQLHEYEQKLFGSNDNSNPALPVFLPVGAPSFSFGFPKANDPVPVQAFIGVGAPSIFTRPLEVPPQEFQFGAGHPQNISESSLGTNLPNPNGGDVSMDS
jgi:dual specificity MAP kinase phosphatase